LSGANLCYVVVVGSTRKEKISFLVLRN